MSLVTRLFALISFTLLMVAGGELNNGLNLRQNQLAKVRNDTTQLARIAELDIVRILEGSRQLLATLAKLPAGHGWDKRACALVEATASSDFEYDHLVAVDRSGAIACSSSGSTAVGTAAADAELINRIVATARFSVGSYGVDRISGNEVIRVGHPVIDDAGTVVGAVYAGINVMWLNTAINQWKLGDNVSIQITDRNGILIANHPNPREVGRPISGDLKPFLFAAGAGAVDLKDAGGIARLYGYTPVIDVDPSDLSNGVAVFVGRDRASIFADINRSILLNAAAVLMALLVSGVIAVMYVRRFLAPPFRNLLSVAERWRAGDWSARAGAASGIREFDRLSLAFDGMAAEVAARDRELRQERDFTTALVDSLPGLFMMIDERHRYVRWNGNLSTVTGIADTQLQGLDALEIVVAGDRDGASAKISEGFVRGSAALEVAIRAKDDEVRIMQFAGRAITREGHPYLLVVGTDVTERKRIDEEIKRLARHDVLTGVANRGVFVEALEAAIADAIRNGTVFAVLYIDLDHFKDVNDTLGHPVGDLLLQSVAARLRAVVRETDTVARFGGDEFALIATALREPADAAILADKILTALSEPLSFQGRELRSGASIGIALYGPDSADVEALLSHADVALYRSKSEGRGTYRFFTDAMDAEVRLRVAVEAELRTAIVSGQLCLLYQPQVDADTARIVGVEALLRWRHPTLGLVSPNQFIPVAEKSGLIVDLGNWVMREACRQMKEWLDAGIAPPLIAVNLSTLQFKTPGELEKNLNVILAESGVPSQRVELELTQSVLMDASRENGDVLLRLRRAGFRVAIDDFGTGFSSLLYLRRYPVDRIKVAQEFMVDLEEGSSNAAIVRAAIALAAALKLDVIVGGVETAEQLALIKSMGARQVQGYYYSKPLQAKDITEILGNSTIFPVPPTAFIEADIV
jgi:diguanylate cyclase (GGDEF)-like protein/PAS domain S-box-containing protein